MTINNLFYNSGQTLKEIEYVFLWNLKNYFKCLILKNHFYGDYFKHNFCSMNHRLWVDCERTLLTFPVMMCTQEFWTPNIILTPLAHHSSDTREQWVTMLVLGWNAKSKEKLSLINSTSGLHSAPTVQNRAFSVLVHRKMDSKETNTLSKIVPHGTLEM